MAHIALRRSIHNEFVRNRRLLNMYCHFYCRTDLFAGKMKFSLYDTDRVN